MPAVALPIVPLVLSWRTFVRQGPRRVPGIALGSLTASYLWVVLVLAGAAVIAPHYTTARSYTINWNVLAVLMVIVVLAIIEKPLRWYHLLAGCGTLVLWLYLGLVGSVA